MNVSGEFRVSVIIPVYNAAGFVQKAVMSALEQEETGEVILVEDGSPDSSLEVCKKLVLEYPYKIKLFTHPEGKNHGAGASRNRGIREASCPCIAFLDADDYYLPGRFLRDKEILSADPSAEGVYNALGIHYHNEQAREQFLNAGYHYQELTTITGRPAPEELFSVLFYSHPAIRGEFQIDTLTVRTDVFQKAGFFHEGLLLQQDTHFMKRLAAWCRLYPGELERPVAMRGVHGMNRMTNQKEQQKFRKAWWTDLKNEFVKKKLCRENMQVFMRQYLIFFVLNTPGPRSLYFLLRYMIRFPGEIFLRDKYFDQLFLSALGKNRVSLHLISFKNRFARHAS